MKREKEIQEIVESLIKRFGIHEVHHKIRDLQFNAPDEAGLKKVLEELDKIGLDRDREPHLKIDKVQVYAKTYKYNPMFNFEISNVAPFKVTLTMNDSYYEPRDIYEIDCGPSYYDKELGTWMQNENWEPTELFSESKTFEKLEDVWKWIAEKVKEWEDKWREMPVYGEGIEQ